MIDWRNVVSLGGFILIFSLVIHFFEVDNHPVIIFCSPDLFYHNRVMKRLKKLFEQQCPDVPVRVISPINRRDMTSLRMACHVALDTKPRLMIVVGAICSQHLIHLTKRINNPTPIIFVGADRPVERGLVDSLDHPGGTVTGTFAYDSHSNLKPEETLDLLLPRSRTILIPTFYSPDQSIEFEQAEEAKKKLALRGIGVTPLPINDLQSTFTWVRGTINGHDGLMILESTLLGSQLVGIARIAQRFQVPMISSALDVVADVPFVYGVDPHYPANMAFDLAQKILAGQKPADLPVVRVFGAYDLYINPTRCSHVGITNQDIAVILERIEKEAAYARLRGHVHMVDGDVIEKLHFAEEIVTAIKKS